MIENVEPGEYTLQFEAPEFEPLTLVVRVDKMVRDINTVILVPEVLSTVMDDSIFAEFDTESGNDAQSLPSSLSASKDVLTTSLPSGSARCVSTCVVTIRSIRTFT